jgi:hypothetical protein
MTSFLLVENLEYYAISWERHHDRIIRPILIRYDTFHFAILAGRAPGRTGTIQDKIAIWTARQPSEDKSMVSFPTPQEDTSWKELADSILLEIHGLE